MIRCQGPAVGHCIFKCVIFRRGYQAQPRLAVHTSKPDVRSESGARVEQWPLTQCTVQLLPAVAGLDTTLPAQQHSICTSDRVTGSPKQLRWAAAIWELPLCGDRGNLALGNALHENSIHAIRVQEGHRGSHGG